MRLFTSSHLFDHFFNDALERFASAADYQDVYRYRTDKTQKTFKNGVLHSVNGEPALVEYDKDGKIVKESWFWEGEKVSKETVKERLQEQEDNKVHLVDLGGKTYKVKGKQLRKIEELLGLEQA